MAGLRVFFSSTCYDLSNVRGQLRTFVQSLGHDPVLSDYNDILYDPRVHTHTSCIDEVVGCDVLVLLVGSRFGGKSVPEAVSKLDFEALQKESKSVDVLKTRENLSVTQLEVLKAVEQKIPVFSFIEERVWHDHALYEKNKDKEILSKISFPSIENPETASYIFEFINFLRHRVRGNSVFSFNKVQDIEKTLMRQWSSLFQRLINEQRRANVESKRIDFLSEQFENLKTAILTSIGSSNEREVARGVVRFRRLVDFLKGLGAQDSPFVVRETHTWQELLDHVGIVRVLESPADQAAQRQEFMRPRALLVKGDGTYFEYRFSIESVDNLALDWDAFVALSPDSRGVIIDALSEMGGIGPRLMRYVSRPIDEVREDSDVALGDLILSGGQ